MNNTFSRTNDNLIMKRGDVFYANLSINGSVQGGCRPVIIISNDMNNQFAPIVQVIPLTAQTKKKNLPVHVSIAANNFLEKDSQALVEQITTINKNDLVSRVGSLPKGIIDALETAIRIQFGFAA